jgi:hypothetical protein
MLGGGIANSEFRIIVEDNAAAEIDNDKDLVS